MQITSTPHAHWSTIVPHVLFSPVGHEEKCLGVNLASDLDYDVNEASEFSYSEVYSSDEFINH